MRFQIRLQEFFPPSLWAHFGPVHGVQIETSSGTAAQLCPAWCMTRWSGVPVPSLRFRLVDRGKSKALWVGSSSNLDGMTGGKAGGDHTELTYFSFSAFSPKVERPLIGIGAHSYQMLGRLKLILYLQSSEWNRGLLEKLRLGPGYRSPSSAAP